MGKTYGKISNPEWEHWANIYPNAYRDYRATGTLGKGRIPTLDERSPPPGIYQWPRWYAMRGTPTPEDFYSFLIWPDDGSGTQRMGTFEGQEYPFIRLSPVKETVTVKEETPAEEIEEIKEFYEEDKGSGGGQGVSPQSAPQTEGLVIGPEPKPQTPKSSLLIVGFFAVLLVTIAFISR